MVLVRLLLWGLCEEEDYVFMCGERGGDCVSLRVGGGRDLYDWIFEYGIIIVLDYGVVEFFLNGWEWEKGYF